MREKKVRYDHLKSPWKRIRQALFRFCIYGSLLVAGEVAFYTITKLGRLVPYVKAIFQYRWEVDPVLSLHHVWEVPIKTFFGQASLYMFFVYGSICVFGLEPAYRWMKRKDVPLILRGLVYMSIILCMECTLGWVLRFFTGYDIWIYYGPGTLFTYTSLAIAPMWFICGLISENVISLIDSFDAFKMETYGLVPGKKGKRNRIVFTSDIHIGPRAQDEGNAGWFYGIYEVYLTIFLYKVSMDKRVKELVFVGDLFDTWLYPPDQKPLSVAQTIELWKDSLFMAPLKRCIARLDTVWYITGNHDMGTRQEELSGLETEGKNLVVVSPQEFALKHTLSCGTALAVEHGHDADFFNAPDDEKDSVQGFPFGYFVARLVSAADENQSVGSALDKALRGAYEKVLVAEFSAKHDETADHRAGRFFIRVFTDALVSWVNAKRPEGDRIGNNTIIKMPSGYRDVTVGEVKQHYSSLLAQWLESGKTSLLVAAGRGGLDRYARKKFGERMWRLWFVRLFSWRNPDLIVIMGHTHFAKIEYIMDREKQGIYANTGCLCKNGKQSGRYCVVLIDGERRCRVKLSPL